MALHLSYSADSLPARETALARNGVPPLEWRVEVDVVPYPEAVAEMENRAARIRRGETGELVWLLEHPHIYTAGTSARPEELLADGGIPVYRSGRGGRYTYHGPGQRVSYVMIDLTRLSCDVRAYVRSMEQWIIESLARLGVAGERRDGRVGIWVRRSDGSEAKIAAIGIRVRRWVTYHGVALNVDPDLSKFEGIVPCGIRDHAVTSLRALGIVVSLAEVDEVLRHTFFKVFAHLRP